MPSPTASSARLRDERTKPIGREGTAASHWVLLDYGSVDRPHLHATRARLLRPREALGRSQDHPEGAMTTRLHIVAASWPSPSLVAACSGGGGAGGSGGDARRQDLGADELRRRRREPGPSPAGVTVDATFDAAASTVSGSSGCNIYNGPYTADGANLTFGQMATTMRACEAPQGAVEGGLSRRARPRADVHGHGRQADHVRRGRDGPARVRRRPAGHADGRHLARDRHQQRDRRGRRRSPRAPIRRRSSTRPGRSAATPAATSTTARPWSTARRSPSGRSSRPGWPAPTRRRRPRRGTSSRPSRRRPVHRERLDARAA